MHGDYIQVYPAPDGHRWRLKAANHEVIAHGEAYTRRSDGVRAALRVCAWTAITLWLLTPGQTRGELHGVRVSPQTLDTLEEFTGRTPIRCQQHQACVFLGEAARHARFGNWIVRNPGGSYRCVTAGQSLLEWAREFYGEETS